jgi:hypothetical protein
MIASAAAGSVPRNRANSARRSAHDQRSYASSVNAVWSPFALVSVRTQSSQGA